MKIAMIGHKRVPSREGGVEIVVGELSRRMVKMGHTVHVYNRMGHHDAGKENDIVSGKDYEGARLITIPTFKARSLNAVVYSFLAAIRALFGGYDIIHFHAEGPCAALWLPHLLGKRCVATIHGLNWQGDRWGGLGTKFILFGEKIAAKYADEIIVLSENVKKYFKDTYNRDTVFIPNGVTAEKKCSPDIIKEKYNLDGDDYILFVGRIVPGKGVHYLIDAFKRVNTDKKLVITGGISYSEDYQKELFELAKGDDRIIFTNFVQGKALSELYANCYLYVLPSDAEGMPISLLEAMSFGRQCLVSDIPECVQAADKYAFTFRKGDAADLEEKLDKIVNGNLKKEPEDKIAAYVRENFDWDRITERILDVYRSND